MFLASNAKSSFFIILHHTHTWTVFAPAPDFLEAMTSLVAALSARSDLEFPMNIFWALRGYLMRRVSSRLVDFASQHHRSLQGSSPLSVTVN